MRRTPRPNWFGWNIPGARDYEPTFRSSGRVEIAGSIAALEIITKIAWCYLGIWAAISWDRN
jgi:hypothetical protein